MEEKDQLLSMLSSLSAVAAESPQDSDNEMPDLKYGKIRVNSADVSYRFVDVYDEEYIIAEDVCRDDNEYFIFGRVKWEVCYTDPCFCHRMYTLSPNLLAAIEYANSLHHQSTGRLAYENLLNKGFKQNLYSLWEMWNGFDVQEEIKQLDRRYNCSCFFHPSDMSKIDPKHDRANIYAMIQLSENALDGEKQYLKFIDHDYFKDQNKIIFLHHDLYLYLLYLKHPSWKDDLMKQLYHQPVQTTISFHFEVKEIVDKYVKEIEELKRKHKTEIKALESRIERLKADLDKREDLAIAYRKLYRKSVDDSLV